MAVDEHGVILPMKPKYCMCPGLMCGLLSEKKMSKVHSDNDEAGS